MRLVVLSDTHEYHQQIKDIPDGDVLIHCGDWTFRGDLGILKDGAQWMGALPHKHKIATCGNHELLASRKDKHKKISKYFEDNGIHYLVNTGIELDGVKYYGSPCTPRFGSWEFMRERGKDIAIEWAKIPEDTNVLITHGPPYKVLDEAPRSWSSFENVGCADLLRRLNELPKLKAHCFGHIHNSSGIKQIKDVWFVNGAICTEDYEPTNPPRVVEIEI